MPKFFLIAVPFFASMLTVIAADRPSILLIFSDDQGVGDVSSYGSEIPTPSIDRIGQEGVRFTHWYSASSICTPSRYGLMTGRNPSRSSDRLVRALMFLQDNHADRGIHSDETTIATRLQGAGYVTSLIGKWHLGHGDKRFMPTRHGFDRFIGHTGGCIDYFTMTYGNRPDWYHQESLVSENGYATELITEEAIEYLESRKDLEQPFFLYLAYNAPHFGKGWSPSEKKAINIMQAEADDLKRVAFIGDKVRREFAAMTISMDDGIGEILDALDAFGLSDDTLVIFLTDHGGSHPYGGTNGSFRGEKATLFEGGVRVPCVMRWPGRIEAGTMSDSVCNTLDLFPTISELAGVDTDVPTLDGKNLAPVLFEDANWQDRTFLWELGPNEETDSVSWRALLDGDWKYVKTPENEEFLFNLAVDPGEQNDLSQSMPKRLEELRTLGEEMSADYRKG